jgi:Pretoxin HINT domain
MSFSAGTKVLLASGAVIPISQLKPGDKVLATNTKTGKTTAEPVAAVLVHHDTDRYDLTVSTARASLVIQTTSSHLFWDQTTGRWTKAASLTYGDYLRTSDGTIATAAGGFVPANADGWMWDLTIARDHDFYINVAATGVLVHNCPDDLEQIQEHVVPRHTPGGSLADETKSIFDPGADLEQLAQGSAGQIGTWEEETSNIS